MTRVHRDVERGLTYVERGTGGGVVIVPDHGGPGDISFRFRAVDETDGAAVLVHDDDAVFTVSAAAEQTAQVLEVLRGAITTAKIPATAKAELRAAIDQAIEGTL